jgi:ketosteroid isomerase-like protein
VGGVFNMTTFSFDDVKILAGERNVVLVQFMEHSTALRTKRSYNEINTVIYTFGDGGVIEDIEVWLDTAAVLDVSLCNSGVKFTCTPFSPSHKGIAKDYLQTLGSGNLTGSYSFLTDSTAVVYRAPPALFPTLGGVWVSKREVMKFFENKGKIFGQGTPVANMVIIATEGPTVVAQFQENNIATRTQRSYQLVHTIILNVGPDERISNIEIVADSATIFSTMSCSDGLLQCSGHKPLGLPRVSDKRPMKPIPSPANSNIPSNKAAVDKYLDFLGARNFEGSLTLLSESASLTWQASSVNFPTLGGTWSGKNRIRDFHASFNNLFDIHNFSFNEINTVAGEANVVVAQYYEHNKALKTNRSYHETNTVIFTFADSGVIADVEIWVNTAGVLDATLCKGSNITCATIAPVGPGETPSKAWIGWIVGIVILTSLGAVGYAYFRHKQRKVSSDLHQGLLGPNTGVN